jgi:16S rRNA (cytosine1402-N4)-methyltransferase
MNNFSHTPVLTVETIEGLHIANGKKYIDATIGGGGHASLIMQNGGVVLGIDQDEDALEYVAMNQEKRIKDKELVLVHGNFINIKGLAIENGFGNVDGILFDLGVSSYQLDSARRGFSIKHEEKLDMRMDTSKGMSAFEVVNEYPRDRLIEIFYRYGEEHNAQEIAEAIVAIRKKGEITTTKELAQIIEKVPHKSESIHPATRVFQAIRIEVNGELDAIKEGVGAGIELLNSKGRIVVISFHSLEDRIIKKMFEEWKREGRGTIVTKKPLIARGEEIMKNKRSRSAKLRVFEKD